MDTMDVIYIGAQGTPTSQPLVESDEQRALGHMKKILQETKGHIFKIGISTNPQTRAYAHNRVAVDERREGNLIYVTFQIGMWDRMYVIFQSPVAGIIRQAERRFIDEAEKSFSDFAVSNLVNMNDQSGGGGPLGASGPYFLYILRSGG